MPKLTEHDFKLGRVTRDDGSIFALYLHHEFDMFQICLEVCMNGYDVAIYDQKKDLVEPKICTNIKGAFQRKTAIRKALAIATEMKNRHTQNS